jgi:hypothetical protein
VFTPGYSAHSKVPALVARPETEPGLEPALEPVAKVEAA